MAIVLNQSNIQLTGTVAGFPDVTSPFTISTWILYNGWASGVTRSMVGLYKAGSTGIQIGSRAANNLSVWTWGGGYIVNSNGVITMPTTEYAHVVYSTDGTTHYLYVNGQLVNTSTSTNTAGIPDIIYINGYPTGGANETGNFSVDDTVYFNRQISANEVLTLYNTRGIRDGIYLGVVSRYTFGDAVEGSVVSQVKDYSENKNHLTVAGTGNSILFNNGVIFADTRPYQ